jgi:two-component system sensor histidine kinase ChvG
VETVVTVANERRREHDPRIRLTVEPLAKGPPAYFVVGHDLRLGQVVNNLIDNARSFSPADGEVRVTLRCVKNCVEIVVEDDGPGIPPHALERIFERFYTDRPDQGFGQNSGLGLSISRQIVEAHGGRIRADNRLGLPGADGEPTRLGARFVVSLPVSG